MQMWKSEVCQEIASHKIAESDGEKCEKGKLNRVIKGDV